MTINLVHISDLHLREGWVEEQGFVLNSFVSDLKEQVRSKDKLFFVFSGDFVQAGARPQSFTYFNEHLLSKLHEVGLTQSNFVLVPGNHDVDRNYVDGQIDILKGLQDRGFNETEFNNFVESQQFNQVSRKFVNYVDWEGEVSDFALGLENIAGKGFALTDEVGVYCLNTALFSFGGAVDRDRKSIEDKGTLGIYTRGIHHWINQTKFEKRILVMHHPFDWLVEWAQDQIHKICAHNFDLVLSGHIHKADAHHQYDGTTSIVKCFAPPLFTRKSDLLGYSIITLDVPRNRISVGYRQWFEDRFLLGVNLARADSGRVYFGVESEVVEAELMPVESGGNYDFLGKALEVSFRDSLKCYASLPAVWVKPYISSTPEFSETNEDSIIVDVDKFFDNLRDCVIKAPSQFGLTSIGKYFAHYCWQKSPGRFTLFIDSSELRNHESAILEYIRGKLEDVRLTEENLHCIVLDEPDGIVERKVNNIKKLYPHVPLIVLLRVNDAELTKAVGTGEGSLAGFETHYLWSLNRAQIREVVTEFIANGSDLDEDSATQRLVDDIENLNLHRAPINCLTLLAVYDEQIDYSPVNRTEMFEKFLWILFSRYKKNPDYSSAPDMKDALYVLGKFCESLIRNKEVGFNKSDFIKSSEEFCAEMSIDVDCMHLFDIMKNENVIVEHRSKFYFRYVHWIYFFCAHRMHHSEDFKNFILSDAFYMSFPEVIEFYSGVDRRREELLKVLIEDLKRVNDAFEARTGINPSFDPYEFARWEPSDNAVNDIKRKLTEEADHSALPVALKDQIADEAYDRTKPYSQEIRDFVRDSSLIECNQIMTAAARALRNSDYADTSLKEGLLHEIMRAWMKTLQVLFLLSPVLAKDRRANFENISFYLEKSFDAYESVEVLWRQIVMSIPFNVVTSHEKDLSSSRMTPLFSKYMESASDEMGKFILAAVLLRSRPGEKWVPAIEKYLSGLSKNSYYLNRVFQMMRHEHRFGFVGERDKSGLMDLMGTVLAKHRHGTKAPNKKTIEKEKAHLASFFKKRDSK